MLRDGPCEEGQDRRVDHMEGDEDEVEARATRPNQSIPLTEKTLMNC